MKRSLIDLLVCPRCLPEEVGLTLMADETAGGDVVSGALTCPSCRQSHPVADGVAVILPSGQQGGDESNTGYESPRALSAYLWSHYADLMGDAEASTAYREWASLLRPAAGISLDAGCAVGRFSFELSLKCDFVIGIDNSKRFIRAARSLLANRTMDFELVLEGDLSKNRRIELPGEWDPDTVEFLVADAQAIPFRSGTFSCLSSLNLVDKLPRPLLHLLEIDRVARTTDSQFLFTDPYSWSREFTPEEHWLGGRTDGEYAGRGVDNVASFLEGKRERLRTSWEIEGQGDIWWKIRNHCNHFELIRSRYIKAARGPYPAAPAACANRNR